MSLNLDTINIFIVVFLGIIVEAVPFLLLGTLASGLVEVFLRPDDISRYIPRHPILAAISGSLTGLFFPVCECGSVPLARRLMRKGLPVPAGISFLMAASVLNPIVIASTWVAFGPSPIFWGRLVITFVIAVIIGSVFSQQRDPSRLLNQFPGRVEAKTPVCNVDEAGEGRTPINRMRRVAVISGDEFFEMGRYLVAGAFLAALMQTFIPQSGLLAIGKGPLLSVLVMVCLAVLLSICSTVDAFIALAFTGTFSSGAILAFLVFGPMVDIKAVLMYLGVFTRKTVVYLVCLSLLLTLVISVGVNYFSGW